MEATAGVVEEIGVLDLRPGELVEVRSEGEILRTLDSSGMLESLPFMPEMLGSAESGSGSSNRADKACDTIEWKTIRRMHNAVHLAELRCDGAAHRGCQAGCLMYWKEAWLKRVGEPQMAQAAATSTAANEAATAVATTETLVQATRAGGRSPEASGGPAKRPSFCEPHRHNPLLGPGQYVRDVRTVMRAPSSVATWTIWSDFSTNFSKRMRESFRGSCLSAAVRDIRSSRERPRARRLGAC